MVVVIWSANRYILHFDLYLGSSLSSKKGNELYRTSRQKNTGKGEPFPVFVVFQQLAVGTHLSEALAAENGTVGLGLEGDLCFAAAASAGSSEEFTGSAGSVLASVTASLAALGLVLEAALCVELLLTGGEHELVATLFAH